MVAVYRNRVIFPIFLIIMGLIFTIIGVCFGVYGAVIFPQSPQASPFIFLVMGEYVGLGILLSFLAYRSFRKNAELLEKTKLIKKDSDKEDLEKIQSIIIEKLEKSIDKTEGGSDVTQKR